MSAFARGLVKNSDGVLRNPLFLTFQGLSGQFEFTRVDQGPWWNRVIWNRTPAASAASTIPSHLTITDGIIGPIVLGVSPSFQNGFLPSQ